MHIAYSALHQVPIANQSTSLICGEILEISEPMLRYQAYQVACKKLSHEIAAIQKYIPGWMPALR